MDRPDFTKIVKDLEGRAQSLKDNARLGESGVVLSISELVKVMDWSSSQLDTSNIQVGNLTDEIKELKSNLNEYSRSANGEAKAMRYLTYALAVVAVLQLVIAYGQYNLGQIQLDVAKEQRLTDEAAWQYEMMRNDRIEQRDVEWRRQDLEAQGRLP